MDGMAYRIKRAKYSQRGFTLIELLAVMAIIAILAAIVAPAVSGTKDTGVQAQAAQDGMQVRTAASDYFSDQNAVEILTTATVSSLSVVRLAATSEDGTTFTGVDSDTATTTISATQKISSRWPEKFITASTTSTAVYYVEFALGASADIEETWVLDFDDEIIGGVDLLTNYTAIDIDTLQSPKEYLAEEPDSADLSITLGGTSVHQLIWLFKKTKSPDSPTDDGREVRVFKLREAVKGSTADYSLIYERVF